MKISSHCYRILIYYEIILIINNNYIYILLLIYTFDIFFLKKFWNVGNKHNTLFIYSHIYIYINRYLRLYKTMRLNLD